MAEFNLLTALTNAKDLEDRGKGAFPNWPTPDEIARINEEVKQTGTPETHPKVCLGPPDPKLTHEIVGALGLQQKIRPDERRVWCCECQKFKFNDGRWLWCKEDGALRMVGHECAANTFGDDQWRLMKEKFDRQEKVRRAENYLLDVLPTLGESADAFARLRRPLGELGRMRNLLKNRAPKLFSALRTACQNDGMLFVVRELDEDDDQPIGPRGFKKDERHQQVMIGRIAGTRFFTETPPTVDTLNELLAKIDWALNCSTDDAVLDFVAALSSDDILERSELVRDWLDGAEKFASRISDYEQFFSTRNFEIIHRWANHPLFSLHTHAEVDGGALIVEEKFEPMRFRPIRRPS